MDKRKIGKYFLLLVILAVVFFFFKAYTLGDIWNRIVEFNLDMAQENIVRLFLTYWSEVLIILIVWDSLILKIFVKTSCLLDGISAGLLKKKKIRLSILCIRLNYSIGKLRFFLRLGWVRYGSEDNDKIVWKSITRPPIKDTVLGICFSLIKFPALIAIFLTAISLKYFELNDIQNKLKTLNSFEFDFWEDIKLLSPLTVVVLIVFIGYFISFRGNIRRTIAQANRKKIEDIIQKQRDLVEAIGNSLYSIASNLQYVINCQELVVDLWIHSWYPKYNGKRHGTSRDWDIESYCFKDILELESISQMFDELKSNGNWSTSRAFSSYKYELLTLMTRSRSLDSKKLNRTFFTKEGMKTIIADDERPIIEYSNEEIQKMRESYLDEMSERIVDSLELLYKLCRYYTEMNKLLNLKSDKVGRTLRIFTGKE